MRYHILKTEHMPNIFNVVTTGYYWKML